MPELPHAVPLSSRSGPCVWLLLLGSPLPTADITAMSSQHLCKACRGRVWETGEPRVWPLGEMLCLHEFSGRIKAYYTSSLPDLGWARACLPPLPRERMSLTLAVLRGSDDTKMGKDLAPPEAEVQPGNCLKHTVI